VPLADDGMGSDDGRGGREEAEELLLKGGREEANGRATTTVAAATAFLLRRFCAKFLFDTFSITVGIGNLFKPNHRRGAFPSFIAQSLVSLSLSLSLGHQLLPYPLPLVNLHR